MDKTALYSIGHGTRSVEELLGLLKKYGIVYLADVRSVPHSKYNPQFNQRALKTFLQENAITYVYMGDSLGGRPKDSLCYTLSGKVDYNVVQTKEFFKEGIARLNTAHEKNIPLAVMCSEYKPEHCHRSRLIGTALYRQGINLLHIDELGELKTQSELQNVL